MTRKYLLRISDAASTRAEQHRLHGLLRKGRVDGAYRSDTTGRWHIPLDSLAPHNITPAAPHRAVDMQETSDPIPPATGHYFTSISDACQQTGIPRSLIDKFMRQGNLTAVERPGSTYVPVDGLRALGFAVTDPTGTVLLDVPEEEPEQPALTLESQDLVLPPPEDQTEEQDEVARLRAELQQTRHELARSRQDHLADLRHLTYNAPGPVDLVALRNAIGEMKNDAHTLRASRDQNEADSAALLEFHIVRLETLVPGLTV